MVGDPPRESLVALLADGRLADVRSALLGRHRRNIMRALGAPPTACVGFGQCVAGATPVTFWQAPTWYYPVSAHCRQAIAIQFQGNRARQIEVIGVE